MAPGGLACSLCSFQCPTSVSGASGGAVSREGRAPSRRRAAPRLVPEGGFEPPDHTAFEAAAYAKVLLLGLGAPREGFEPSSVALTGRRTAGLYDLGSRWGWTTGVAGWKAQPRCRFGSRRRDANSGRFPCHGRTGGQAGLGCP